MTFPILQLDLGGNPCDWISHRQAISLIATDKVIANLGTEDVTFFGGQNRVSGLRSEVSVGSILLTKERIISRRLSKIFEPPFLKRILYARDRYRCLYCGDSFSPEYLTRDHIIPDSRNGSSKYSNSATCCKSCNHEKADRTPEEWGVLLKQIPFSLTWAEFLYLQKSHRMIYEQHEYLQDRFPKNSLLRSEFLNAA